MFCGEDDVLLACYPVDYLGVQARRSGTPGPTQSLFNLRFLPAAIVDSVEENIQASRRLLLLYTASTFVSKRHTSSTSSNNNNIISKSSNTSGNTEGKAGDSGSNMCFDDSEDLYQDTRQQLECVAAMHRALLEGSLNVRKQTLSTTTSKSFYFWRRWDYVGTTVVHVSTCCWRGELVYPTGKSII